VEHVLERAGREHVAGERQQLVVAQRLASVEVGDPAARTFVVERRGDVEPLLADPAPLESEIAITLAPAAAARLASWEPTLPKPWIAILSPSNASPRRSSVSSRQTRTLRPVASSRPSDPPIASGFPVTTLSTEWP